MDQPTFLHRLRFGRRHPPHRAPYEYTPPNKPQKPSSPELYTTLSNINEQLDSFLFNGSIAPEIRDMIFAFAFTDDLDLSKSYEENTHYTRPGHTHKRKTSISLLLTCKRVYGETYHLPLLMKSHTFYLRDPARAPPRTINQPVPYFSELPPSQLEFLQSFHFFAQQYWLEDEFNGLCQQNVMKHIVDLKITFRRSDWWLWENDAPLAITPYSRFPSQEARSNHATLMKAMWEHDKQNPGVKREFDPKYWGSAFQHLPKLKTLTIEFETEKSCEAQVDAIAENAAKGWKFPMGETRILSAEGNEINKWEWEGPYCMRSQSQTQMRVVGPPARPEVFSEAQRPILVVRAVQWKLVNI